MKYLLIIVTVLILASCKTYSDEELNRFDEQIELYLEKKSIECKRSSSGLYYKIIEPGEGKTIQYRDHVSFTYKGTLLDGTVFDDQKEPVEFEVSALIGAWKEIMLELKKGGKAYLISPPQLGYGSHHLDDIPENSILIFEMEVVDVK